MKSEETKNIGLRGITIADTHISLVDGEGGRLFYRGYPIQQLAEQATFEEVVYLLLYGSAPTRELIQKMQEDLRGYRRLPDELVAVLRLFRPGAGPMDVMQALVAALAQFDPDLQTDTREAVGRSCLRLIARFASLAAAWQRIRSGARAGPRCR